MSASKEYIDFIKELLHPLEPLSYGKFFGGFSFKSNDRMFAMIMGNCLYFCVNDATRKKYTTLGMQPFSYSTKVRLVKVNKYYLVPEDLLEDPQELIIWAGEAIDAAFTYKK